MLAWQYHMHDRNNGQHIEYMIQENIVLIITNYAYGGAGGICSVWFVIALKHTWRLQLRNIPLIH